MAKILRYAELRGQTRSRWLQALDNDQHKLLTLSFIEKIVSYRIYFLPATNEHQIRRKLERVLLQITNGTDIIYHWQAEPASDRLLLTLKDFNTFTALNFGSDVAEQDEHLAKYFISTPAYRRCKSKEKCLIIGPKGSGKTAILRILNQLSPTTSVVITPEVFATSVLRRFIEETKDVWDEAEAFISTWIFTILVEVFKRVSEEPRGVKAKSFQRIREFLRDHSDYSDADMFTRFIMRLKTIQAIKLGKYELSIKTRKLQELYSLERVYSLIPDLRKALRDDILVLIDELDQGWDNTAHSNRFISSLMQAALKVQNLGLRAHVIAFLRSEIFDLIKYTLDQLDKLRSGIEELRWNEGQLRALILLRIAFNCNIPSDEIELTVINDIFGRSLRGWSVFDYIVSRTCRRPREVLQFVREAHQIAIDSRKKEFDNDVVLEAEERFSGWKIEHVCSEYKWIYPGLSDLLWCFRGKGPMLGMADLTDIFSDFMQAIGTQCPEWAKVPPADLAQRLYEIEFLGSERPRPRKGIPGALANYEFAYERPAASVRRSHTFLIHPAMWEVLELEQI